MKHTIWIMALALCVLCFAVPEAASAHEHAYTVATCVSPAVCSCGYTLGKPNPNRHVGATKLIGAIPAQEFTAGYTGDTFCADCSALLSKGEPIPATHKHAFIGGNCTQPGVCACGATGSVSSAVHTGRTEIRDFQEEGEFTNGYTGNTYCLDCNRLIQYGERIPMRHQVHSYAAATCVSPARCACGLTTGERNPGNHGGGTELRNAVAASEFTTGYSGDEYCLGCGAQLTKGFVTPTTHRHTFSAYTFNATEHWQVCIAGDASTEKAEHQFKVYAEDDGGHRVRCFCGATRYIAHFDGNENGQCDVCGYAVSASAAHTARPAASGEALPDATPASIPESAPTTAEPSIMMLLTAETGNSSIEYMYLTPFTLMIRQLALDEADFTADGDTYTLAFDGHFGEQMIVQYDLSAPEGGGVVLMIDNPQVTDVFCAAEAANTLFAGEHPALSALTDFSIRTHAGRLTVSIDQLSSRINPSAAEEGTTAMLSIQFRFPTDALAQEYSVTYSGAALPCTYATEEADTDSAPTV